MINKKLKDQSTFVNQQENLAPPPEVLEKLQMVDGEKAKKKRVLIITAVIGLLLFTLLIVVLIKYGINQGDDIVITPTPKAVQPGFTKLETELRRLEKIVKQADPSNEGLVYPSVDMEVTF